MGCAKSSNELNVSTINFSGILSSPFEFYSQEYHQEQEALSKSFKQLLQQNMKQDNLNSFNWKVGKIDKKAQKQRYTPIYRQQAGIEKGKLMNEQEFRIRWREEFQSAKRKVKIEASDSEIKQVQNFDFLCYRALVYYLYGVKDPNKFPNENPQKYSNLMNKYFAKSFLYQSQKIQRTVQAILDQKTDIYFFQQASRQFITALESNQKLLVIKNQTQSIIILRKEKFTKIYPNEEKLCSFPKSFQAELNWNEDSIMCFVDNYILFSFHLSSKKQKNKEQMKKMAADLQTLAGSFKNYHIIAGGDANAFVPPELMDNKFVLFPNSPNYFTTMKKRTWLQPQAHKAEELSAQVKDVIITNLPYKKERVTTIYGKDAKQLKYIPDIEHPCDHFVSTVCVVVE